MFRFFRPKPPPAAPTTPAADSIDSDGRPRTALEWLNADVGELFFGKKPPPQPQERDDAAIVDAAVVADEGAGSDDDRSGWLAKLKSGLQRTGSTLAGAFIGAEIGDELWDDLEVALLQADTGADATLYLLDDLQARVTRACSSSSR